MRSVVIYHYRGQVERGPWYDWRDGYSANHPKGGVVYPWLTKNECRDDAGRWGARAVFCECGRSSPPAPCRTPLSGEREVAWGAPPPCVDDGQCVVECRICDQEPMTERQRVAAAVRRR